MERRRALAVAGATVLTSVAGAMAVAANLGVGVLGFGGTVEGAAPPTSTTATTGATSTTGPPTTLAEPVVVTEVVYDDQYVLVPTAASPARSEAPPAGTPVPTPATAPTPPAALPVPTTTLAPTSPTTTPPSLPPGFRVPEDWPASEPYPPIPPGCERGVLEDDGRWNCQDREG